MQKEASHGFNWILFWIFSATVILVIGVSFYKFFWLKDYDFIVEASCDPSIESCYVRDCSTPGDCPPNELEVYKMYVISAGDFSACKDDSCLIECTNGTIACQEVLCGESEEDECFELTVEDTAPDTNSTTTETSAE
jgi:hypothetical protein